MTDSCLVQKHEECGCEAGQKELSENRKGNHQQRLEFA